MSDFNIYTCIFIFVNDVQFNLAQEKNKNKRNLLGLEICVQPNAIKRSICPEQNFILVEYAPVPLTWDSGVLPVACGKYNT